VKRTVEALAAIEVPLKLIQHTHESFFEPELHRFRGELLLQLASPTAAAEAEECFWRAVKIARQQSAKSWELRAATSLSQLWAQHSKRTEALQLLSPLCAWFTEGPDTPDFKKAKRLLEKIREG
jgi:predicted ATPase